MAYYFSKEFAGPAFELYYPPHLIALGMVLIFVLFLCFLRQYKSWKLNNIVRWSLAALLVCQEVAYHLWNLYIDEWTLQNMLPLHICSVFVWLNTVMLVTRNRHIFEFAFFLGIAGALQALLTPDIAEYGFPHFRFFHVFISHGTIILAALYMTLVEGYRPTWFSLAKVMIGVNIYTVFVFVINHLIGSNYLYITHKPETASLFDLLGPWPIYIFAAEGIALAMFVILYLPFAVYDHRVSRAR